MKYFIEGALLPDPETPLYYLWEKLYPQIHLALVELKNREGRVGVGISFPDYCSDVKRENHLGNRLRLFTSVIDELQQLNLRTRLLRSRLTDYIHITSIRDVPDKIEGYAHFKRLQPKSNNHRLARRKAKRDGISIEEAATYFNGRKEIHSRVPFVRIKSQGSGKQYHLMISREEVIANVLDQGFSTYGLSATSTVPLF